MEEFIFIILGIFLLFAGRKLFWLFVGAVGFVVGITLAQRFIVADSEALKLGIALLVGIVGAGLAILLQNLAVSLAGFFAGGYGLVVLLRILGWLPDQAIWIVFVVGGIFGAALVAVLFEWALIILSVFLGTTLLVQAFDLSQMFESVLFVALFCIGMAVQIGWRHRDRARKQPSEASHPPAKSDKNS